MKWLKALPLLQWKLWKLQAIPGLVGMFILLIIFLILTYMKNRPPKPPPAPKTIGITVPTAEKGNPQMSVVIEDRNLSSIENATDALFEEASLSSVDTSVQEAYRFGNDVRFRFLKTHGRYARSDL